MSRSYRKNIAEDTLATLERGSYVNQQGVEISIREEQAFAVANTKLYRPEESDALLQTIQNQQANFETRIEVTPETSLDAVRRLIQVGESEVFCLNFASAKNPGGGFLGGSQAQEESIARSTGLYPCQLAVFDYYTINRKTKTCLYTDHMIYSPRVPILKDEEGDYADQLMTVSILTAPAVNAGIVRKREPRHVKKIKEVMRHRIAKVLAIAKHHEHEVLVLGAWGCGVFQNDPQEIAQYFREVLEEQFKGQFRKIVFAIYAKNPRFITPFQQQFM
ncbi:MAG: TIGR02452 family protein [Flammeovirgaceae bacterium]